MKTVYTLLALLFSWFQFAQVGSDIIVEYSPVQSRIVGKTLVQYTKEGQVLFGPPIPNIETMDEDSSTEETKNLERRLSIILDKIFKGEYVKEININAYNVKVTNISNPVESLPFGRIIMSAQKADSVLITVTKKNNYKLSAKELIEKIRQFSAIPAASSINAVALIDSINYLNNTTFKVTVKNPNVYYSFIAGQVAKEYANNSYVDLERQLGEIILRPNSTTDGVKPKSSNMFNKYGFAKTFKLHYDVSQGNKKLWILANREDGGVDSLEVKKNGNRWSSNGLLITSSIPGKVTKRYYIDIEAQEDIATGNIIIDNAEIRYPEFVFKAIPRKKLSRI